MNDLDAIDYYDILKKSNYNCRPYFKKAVEIHIEYPLTYNAACGALDEYGEKRLQELVDMVFMGHSRKEEDYVDIREFVKNYC